MMKKSLLCGAVIAAMFSVSAGAQTCASPLTWTPDTNGAPTLTGDTCNGGETGILSICEAASDGHGHAYVARITSAAAGTYTNVTVQNSGFTAYVAVVPTSATGACNGGGDTGHCVTSGDTATPIQHANVPDGDYFLIISNSGVDLPAACGAFTLTANGTLPVTLQDFSVI